MLTKSDLCDSMYTRYLMCIIGGTKMKEKEDVTLNDVRRYGDLLNRTDWVYDKQNHSIQDWYYQGENLRIKMVDGECIYIRILDE